MKFIKDNIKLYNENLIHQKNYKLNAIKKYENNYKHIFNNIDLLQNIDTGDIETDLLNNKPKEYTLYLFNDFYTFYCEILELKKNFKEIIFDKIIEINNENAKKIKILENYNKYNQFVNVCFNSLNSYLEIISNYNAININDYKHNIYETFEINKTIETLNSYFNQTLKANNIKIENHFNKDLGFYTIDIYEPESQNNSNADTGDIETNKEYENLLNNPNELKKFINEYDLIQIGNLIKTLHNEIKPKTSVKLYIDTFVNVINNTSRQLLTYQKLKNNIGLEIEKLTIKELKLYNFIKYIIFPKLP